MTIVDRIRALGFPEDQFIVIGSGLLDVYGLRKADDIDLLLTPELFAYLGNREGYVGGVKRDESYLKKDDLDVWLSWGKDNDFASLKQSCVIVDGLLFVNPQFLIERKRERGTQKDLNDIRLLEGHLA